MLIIDSKKIRKYSKIVKFDLIHPISNPKRYQSIKHYKKKINIRKPKRRKKKKTTKRKFITKQNAYKEMHSKVPYVGAPDDNKKSEAVHQRDYK